MRKFLKKVEPFHLIFILFFVFFSLILFLSIPSIFDYKKLQSNITRQIESDFNLKFLNLSSIEYRFIPMPHLVIGKSELNLIGIDNTKIADLEEAKIFISLFQLYNMKKIKINKLHLSNETFTFNKDTLRIFIDHLYIKNTKPIYINKSKFFFENKDQDVITISQIKNLSYFINEKSNQKKLKIKGDLFDTDFDLKWFKNPNNLDSNFVLKFKNPNISLENELELLGEKHKKGNFKIVFLNNKINLKYEYLNEQLTFETIEGNINNLNLDGNISFKPFNFNLKSEIKKQKMNYLIKNILLNYFKFKDNIHPNINGDLNVQMQKIENAYFKSGKIKFNFSDRKIFIKNNELEIKNIGKIIMRDNLFYEEKGEVFFVADVELIIINQDEFFRRFSIPIKNRKEISKLYLIFEKNIDKDNYSISNFSATDDAEFNFNEENIKLSDKIYFNNFQKFRNVIKDEFIKIN